MTTRSCAPLTAPPPPSRANAPGRTALGRLGEALAAAHMVRLGFTVLARNVSTPAGEIDLIACDRRVLVFAEVKCRRAGHTGAPQRPLDGLRPRQRARLRRLACAWLADERIERPYAATLRFDAIGVLVDDGGALLELEHLEGAW